MDQKRFSETTISLNRRLAAKFALCMTVLLFPLAAHAGFSELSAPGSVTLSDIKKGQRVTLNVSYIDVSDSEDLSGDAYDGEQTVASATVTVSGASGSATVNSLNTSQSIIFIAPQDAPIVNVTMTYTGTGPVGKDGDDGWAILVWHGVDKDSGDPPCDAQCGDPINALTGNSFQKEVDYVGAGDFPLMFVRYYNSINQSRTSALGNAWSHSYNQYTDPYGNLYRAEGPKYGRSPYGLDPDVLVTQVSFNGYTGNLYLNKQTNVLESYDTTTGRLLALYDLKGNSQTMAYDSAGRLVSVTHSNGRALQFTYDAIDRIATMTDPSGAVYSYTYDANNNLISVTHPDSSARQYVYGNASFPNAMTGLIDELGNTYATWAYDANGYATSSSIGGGLVVESTSAPDASATPHTITNGAGTTRTLVAANVNGKQLPGMVTVTSSGATNIATHSAVYDSAGNVTARTNNNGSLDCFTYNGKEQETTALYNGAAYGGSCQTTQNSYHRISTWHPNLYVRTGVAGPSKQTYMIYHQQPDPNNGNAVASCITPANTTAAPYLNIVCKTVEYATTDSRGDWGPSTTAYVSSAINNNIPADVHTYTYDPNGRVLTATDALGKVTTYAYYQDTTVDHTVGDLQSITNNLGQVLTFNRYDKNGRVLQTTDANGLVSTVTYDYRGNALSRMVGALTTNYVYDSAGQLKTVQAPDGTNTTNSYDLAHRMSKTTDNAGNSVNYTYDSVGNVASVTLKDNLGNTVKTSQYSYDYMNNIVKSIGSAK